MTHQVIINTINVHFGTTFIERADDVEGNVVHVLK